MDLTFDMHAVRQWADFSGDYNPIHFDLAQARYAGLDALIVHGMLALIPIKQALAETHAANNPDYAKWMKFRAAFRNPIAHDSVNTLATRATSRGITFHLSNGDETGAERFRGAWGPADDSAANAVDGARIGHRSILDNAQLRRFSDAYPSVQASWIALDAAVFADFMRTKLELLSDIAIKQLGGAAEVGRVVVQTSHTVYADVAALPDTPGGAPDWGRMSYAMVAPVMLAQNGQVSGSVTLPVYRNETLVMLVEIGLLAKVSTPSNLN